MADSTRPTDGSRPSDPKELVFQKDSETLRPEAQKNRFSFDLISTFLSAALGAGMTALYTKLCAMRTGWNIFPAVPNWVYYGILVFIFLGSSAIAYRLLRSSSS